MDILHLDLCIGNTVTNVYYSWDEIRSLRLPEGNQFKVIVNSSFEGIKSTSKHKYELHCNEQSFRKLFEFRAKPNTGENVLPEIIMSLVHRNNHEFGFVE